MDPTYEDIAITRAYNSAQHGEYKEVRYMSINLTDNRHPDYATEGGLSYNRVLDILYTLSVEIKDRECTLRKYIIDKFFLVHNVSESTKQQRIAQVASGISALKISHRAVYDIKDELQLLHAESDGLLPMHDKSDILVTTAIEQIPLGFIAVRAYGTYDDAFSKIRSELVFPSFANPAKVLSIMKDVSKGTMVSL